MSEKERERGNARERESVWVRVYAHAPHKSDFLGNADFNFKSFPGTLFKGKAAHKLRGKIPPPGWRTEASSSLQIYCYHSFGIYSVKIYICQKSNWF